MKEKVMSLAQGQFTYEQPDIVLSTDQLELDVREGGEAEAIFHVKNALGTKIKGFCSVEEFDIDFLPVFDGKENVLTVKVHAGTRKAGEVLTGDIHIITDCGEKTLPYRITVTGTYLEGICGEITSYEEFVQYAKEHFDQAVPVFYEDKFKWLYLREMGERRLYQYLTLRNPKQQALEEFLVAHGDKKPVQYMVNKKQLAFDVEDEDIAGEFMVVKDSWGMAGVRLASDHSFLTLNREHLRAGDFVGNQAVVSFRICPAQVPPGVHRCRVMVETVFQTLEVGIRVHGIKGADLRRKRLAQKKLTARLVRSHIQQMMNSSLRESWLQLLETNRDKLFAMFRGSELQLDGYISHIAGNAAGQRVFQEAVERMAAPALGDKREDVYRYLFALYLKVKNGGSQEERDELISQIRNYYVNGYRHWLPLVLLERLGYYRQRQVDFLEELDLLWDEGYSSPYMHLYRILIILQDMDHLKSLDARTTGALRFASKHDLLTEDLVIAVSLLAVRKKKGTPALLKLLEKGYELYGNKDTLRSICTLLIRMEKQESKYFKWFQLGVEHSLRITELFEYYMYTMEPEQFDDALATVITYFKYENHLRESVKTSFYASIVRNREEHPEYFEAYRDVIRRFALEQLRSRRIGKELAGVYDAFLLEESIQGYVAKELPYILFAYHVRGVNKNMERVVVVHDEGGGETKYNLVNGEAMIHIGTPHFKLYFEDKDGFYHTQEVSCHLEKLLHLDVLAWSCYENGSEHPLLLLHLFSQILERGAAGSRDAIVLHTMIRSGVPGMEYRNKALLALYDYYRSIGEEPLLEEIIKQIDFEHVGEEKRAGILQTMIQHKMKDEALRALRKYRITNCSRKLILLLATWKLEENNRHFDPYFMKLCDFLYQNGVSNAVTLSYLTNFYMGSTEHLHDIYVDAKRCEAVICDGGTERLLGQALFISDDPEKYADIFLDYFNYGANRILVKAFLSYTAYEYVVGKCGLACGILSKLRKEGFSEKNPVIILAMLKYYSTKDTYTDAEQEYIAYHLSQFAAVGQPLSFMKAFTGKVEVPFEIANMEIFQVCCSSRGNVYIEFQVDGCEKAVQPMRQVFEDIYVYEMLLFRDERLTYRIYAEDRGELKQGVVERKKGSEPWEISSFYRLINEMIRAREGGNKKAYDGLVEQYKGRRQTAGELLKPIG